jgi:hypothetical protein
VTTFLAEIGKRLAARWMELLVLPGALWAATAFAGEHLGHAHAFDVAQLRSWLDQQANTPSSRSFATVLLAAGAFLALAAAVGLTASAAGSAVQRLRVLPGRRGVPRWMVTFRRWRWRKATEKYKQAIAVSANPSAYGTDQGTADNHTLLRKAKRAQLGDAYPLRPTWIADRFLSANTLADAKYGLDLELVWPRLWTLLPETLRGDLTAAQDAYSAASRLTAWGLLYLLLTFIWWPALAIGAVVLATGEMRSRSAASTLTDLIATSTDLHTGDLADKLGVTMTKPLTRDTGKQIMKVLINSPADTALISSRATWTTRPQ